MSKWQCDLRTVGDMTANTTGPVAQGADRAVGIAGLQYHEVRHRA